MKTAIFLLSLLVIACTAKAQTDYSSESMKVCAYNAATEKYDGPCTTSESACRFTWNADHTMFTHVTPTITSTYYVDEKEVDKASGLVIYGVTSDVGNKYYCCFDDAGKEVRLISNKKVADHLLRQKYLVSL